MQRPIHDKTYITVSDANGEFRRTRGSHGDPACERIRVSQSYSFLGGCGWKEGGFAYLAANSRKQATCCAGRTSRSTDTARRQRAYCALRVSFLHQPNSFVSNLRKNSHGSQLTK